MKALLSIVVETLQVTTKGLCSILSIYDNVGDQFW